MNIYKKPVLVASALASAIALNTHAAPTKPNIDWLAPTYNETTELSVKWNMWWGENATSWQLSNNGTKICGDTLTPNGQQAQSASCLVSLNEGTHKLVVTLMNDKGHTASDPTLIQVKGESGNPDNDTDSGDNTDDNSTPDGGDESTAGAPAKPTLGWLSSSLTPGEHAVSWDMWWGENGSSWRLLDNDQAVCDGSLEVNPDRGAQSGACTVNFEEGSHSLTVELSNTKGSTLSDTKLVTVSNSSSGGDDSSGDGIGSGDTPLPTDFASERLRKHTPYKNTTNAVVGSYFVEWGIYGRDYHPADIPAANLTHILYGFIPICGPNKSLQEANSRGYSILQQQCANKKDYEVTIHDKFAALEKSYPGDKWKQDYKGTFNQFRRIKKAYPDLKVLPSVGGWTLSDPFFDLDNDANRATFVNSVVEFLTTYTFFDGVDIDWEFPGGGGANPGLGQASDGATYVTLMKDLRIALNKLGDKTGKTYQVTSAIGASPEKIARIDYNSASQYMDHIFMMTYDYYGAWNGELGHQTGIYDAKNAHHKDWSLDGAVKAMEKQHVDKSKLVAGVAMYGRGWEGVTNVQGNDPLTGTGGKPLKLATGNGHWESGVIDYFRIIDKMLGGDYQSSGINGWQSGYDNTAEAPYVWHPQNGQFITYDNPRSVEAKSEYVTSQGLGGVFSWEIDADNGELLNATHKGLKHPVKE